MKSFFIYRFLASLSIILFTFNTTQLNAQAEIDERAMVSFDRGLGFHAPDTSFGVYLRFRMQNRLGFTGSFDDNSGIDDIEARIRRLRLRLDGYTINENLTYYIQLSFSRGDLDWDNSQVPNIIRDAMVYYSFSDNFYIGFGQGKLPGNRQRINSSGQLQFTDRSNVNARYNLDRDFGLMGYYSNNFSGFYYNIKTAVTTGEGRNALSANNGLSYTGRIELLPFGEFSGNGDFSEGDLEREPFPVLSVAGGYHFNHNALKTQGQRGGNLYEPRNIESLFLDAIMKYNGWSLILEYIDRKSDNPVTVSENNKISHVKTGSGFNGQLSYLFPGGVELAGRYTILRPREIVATGLNIPGISDNTTISDPPVDEYTVGVTRYLKEHKIKLQGNLGYRITDPVKTQNRTTDWILQFQIELGI